MRKIIPYMFVLIILLTAVSALKVIEQGEIVVEDQIDENLYAAGNEITIDANINGDLTAFGGEINVNSPISKHSTTFGGAININAPVGEGVHACGGDININSIITGDLMSAGGNINVNNGVNGDIRIMGGNINLNQNVLGDIIAMGGNININSQVFGDMVIMAGELKINSIIEGNVEVKAGKIKLGKDALIKGDLKYTSDEIMFKEEQIEGTITKEVANIKLVDINKNDLRLFGAFVLLLISIIIVLIMPNVSNKLSDTIRKKPLQTILFGLLSLIAIPAAAVLFAITIIGLPITIILIMIYILAIYLSKIFASLYIGKLIIKKPKNLVMPMALGIVIYIVLTNTPYIGGIVKFLAMLLGLGAMKVALTNFFRRNKTKKKTKKKKS